MSNVNITSECISECINENQCPFKLNEKLLAYIDFDNHYITYGCSFKVIFMESGIYYVKISSTANLLKFVKPELNFSISIKGKIIFKGKVIEIY